MTTSHTIPVRIYQRGKVPEYARDLATVKVSSVLERRTAEPVLSTRVTLMMAPDPAVARPAVAEASIDVKGRILHVQAAGRTMHEAVALMADRLRIRLERTARY